MSSISNQGVQDEFGMSSGRFRNEFEIGSRHVRDEFRTCSKRVRDTFRLRLGHQKKKTLLVVAGSPIATDPAVLDLARACMAAKIV